MKWSSLFSRLGDEQVSELAELAWWKSRSDSSRVVLLISSSGLQMRVCLLQSTCLMRMKTGVTNKTLRLWAKLSWRTPRRRTAAIMSRWEIHTVKLPAAREGQTLFSYRPLANSVLHGFIKLWKAFKYIYSVTVQTCNFDVLDCT